MAGGKGGLPEVGVAKGGRGWGIGLFIWTRASPGQEEVGQ